MPLGSSTDTVFSLWSYNNLSVSSSLESEHLTSLMSASATAHLKMFSVTSVNGLEGRSMGSCAPCHAEKEYAWASYQMRKIAGCACAGNAGNVSPATDFKGNR